MEKRIVGAYELRAAKNSDGSMNVSGYAATYNTLSHELGNSAGKFRERIAKRAFDGILRTNPDVVATLNHSVNHVLGRTAAGTLVLRGDDTGLHFRCNMSNTSYARDLYENLRAGNLSECSFAFELGDRSDEDWSEEEIEEEEELGLRGATRRSKQLVRTIKNFKRLHDISIVTNAAYPGTSVDARMELVSAEARSFAEHRLNPKPKPQVWQRGAIGVYFESDADDLLNQRARQRMLQEILD